jgi:hypothetical protein
MNHSVVSASVWAGRMFRPRQRDETKLGRDETIFGSSEGIPKRPVGIKALTKRRAETAHTGDAMIKALSAIAIAAFAAAALTVLPGFAPTVEASVPQALAKADRLDIHPVGRDCSQQAWPNFEASCLRASGTKAAVVREARLVTANRMP